MTDNNFNESPQYPRIKDNEAGEMLITPTCEYTWAELDEWFAKAQEQRKVLVLDPCNPRDVPFFHTRAYLRTRDDVAVLSQWLGGLKGGS